MLFGHYEAISETLYKFYVADELDKQFKQFRIY
jgi:hypothetical protein